MYEVGEKGSPEYFDSVCISPESKDKQTKSIKDKNTKITLLDSEDQTTKLSNKKNVKTELLDSEDNNPKPLDSNDKSFNPIDIESKNSNPTEEESKDSNPTDNKDLTLENKRSKRNVTEEINDNENVIVIEDGEVISRPTNMESCPHVVYDHSIFISTISTEVSCRTYLLYQQT